MIQGSLIMSQKPGDFIIGIPTLEGWTICEGMPPKLNAIPIPHQLAFGGFRRRLDVG